MIASRLLILMSAIATCAMPAATANAQAGIELRQSVLGEADFGAARLGGRETGLRLRGPEVAFARGQLVFGADYAYTHYRYRGLPTRNRDLHRLALPLHWTGGTAHRVHVHLVPTVATSSNVFKDLFDRGNGDDFALYGGIAIERAPEHGWGWRYGAAYDDAFGDPRAYPVLALLRHGERFDLELGWPATRLRWRTHPRLQLEAALAPAGNRWHVVSDERGGAEFDYTVEAWRGTLGLQWTMAPHWRLRLDAGVEFDRHHDFENDTGIRIDRDADAAPFLALTLWCGP